MSAQKNPTVAVSAPGKVLLAGGYLVLDRQHTGLVFGLSARINVIAGEIHTSEGVQLNEIIVDSPQFEGAQWRYGYHRAPEGGGIQVVQLQVGEELNKNPFVETTLSYVLSYVDHLYATRGSSSSSSSWLKPARLIILADNDYYSTPGDKQTAPNARFANFGVPLASANKTGLGSSAALVTALTASLLAHYLPKEMYALSSEGGPDDDNVVNAMFHQLMIKRGWHNLPEAARRQMDAYPPQKKWTLLHQDSKEILHNLAQAAHCAAQGKVGSGFDVAAAVFGSCLYRRFSPSVLDALPEPGTPAFASDLGRVVDGTAWDVEVSKKVDMPQGLALRMCDVDCGSQTVGMVKKVLAWREQEAQVAGDIWGELQAYNDGLASVLNENRTEDLTMSLEMIRGKIREMSGLSGVPIEPESQTKLLDALTELDGVFGGVVPGAGGFDALALLMRDDEETKTRVMGCLAEWSKEKDEKVKLMDVRGEMEGVRMEELDIYKGWL
ncbi:phosphomevalonate kinase [Emericellopsis cladophorae]|uniref:Phosphomevalonate kinase n=1 Tax=Emericellopsis cladophorae TaxID=2686198 RepID=A0A9Q0BAY8_9HYPO|nr:phosphomevalonate kinase [Emericellopsis cladophorae]KAI6777950.1 phosphomevalonate kinase [Emericellopsis cladophorae]